MVVGMRLCRVGDADLACRLRQPSDTRVCDAAVTSLDLGAARVCVVTTKGDRAPANTISSRSSCLPSSSCERENTLETNLAGSPRDAFLAK
jgi:hypothetical protein